MMMPGQARAQQPMAMVGPQPGPSPDRLLGSPPPDMGARLSAKVSMQEIYKDMKERQNVRKANGL